jgi:hypothetical protein
MKGGSTMETVNCRGEQKELHEAAATYDKHCRPACSMHDTCSVLFIANRDKWKEMECPFCKKELDYGALGDGWQCDICNKFFGYEMVIEGELRNYGRKTP